MQFRIFTICCMMGEWRSSTNRMSLRHLSWDFVKDKDLKHFRESYDKGKFEKKASCYVLVLIMPSMADERRLMRQLIL